MATRTITLKGPSKWARVFEENRDMKGYEGVWEECEGAYTVELGLDSDMFATLKEAGSMKKGRVDGGLTWVKFVRKHKDRFEWSSGAPEVTDSTDGLWSMEMDGEIYNDSELELTISVYDTSRPSIKGTRLDKVKVIRPAPKPEPKVTEEIPF